MADNDVHLNVRLPEKERTKFYKVCKKNGAVPAVMTRQLLKDYALGNISYEPSQLGEKPA